LSLRAIGATIAFTGPTREVRMTDVVVTESRAGELIEALHAAATPELEHVFANRDAVPSDLVLVAWSGVEPVGYLVATMHGSGVVEVWEHAVAPAYRQRGVGRTLLYELARRVAPGAVVRVDPAHQLDLARLADYYRRCGFTHVAATQEILATGAELLRATGRSPAGNRGAPVASLLRAKGRDVVTIGPDATVPQLLARLNEHRIGAVPVSRDGLRIEGIVSERDVLEALGREGAAVLDRRVRDVMTPDVVTCTAGDGVELVMSLMTRLRIRHVPVTEEGRLVGIVSVGDIVRQRLEQVERENEEIREYISAGR
jgi:CBS domain-containing protein/predicted N-acetyltransferase YhbS